MSLVRNRLHEYRPWSIEDGPDMCWTCPYCLARYHIETIGEACPGCEEEIEEDDDDPSLCVGKWSDPEVGEC